MSNDAQTIQPERGKVEIREETQGLRGKRRRRPSCSRPTAQQRFWEKVEKLGNESGCWLWIACRNNNPKEDYGVIRFNGKNRKAHRVSWILAYGEIPDGMLVLHKCDTPCCVNPNHLRLGNDQENMKDRDSKGRHWSDRGTYLTRKRPRGFHSLASMTLDEKDTAQTMLRQGASNAEVMRKYSISYHAADNIRKRKHKYRCDGK